MFQVSIFCAILILFSFTPLSVFPKDGGVRLDCDSVSNINIDELFWAKKGSVIEIRNEIDLKGKTLLIPDDCILRFYGGKITNGKVIGSKTKIERKRKTAIFRNVSIEGTWNISTISSSFFEGKENVLQQVFALSDSLIYNKIIIEKGNYIVSRTDSNEGILNLKSNSDVEIKGVISVEPNNYSQYYILNLKDVENVLVFGGSIIGDREEHIGSSGEWGHGIFIWGNSENIRIEGVDISNCWGDGVAIGRSVPVKNVELYKLRIENCRRNGISVIACEGCSIKKCTIKNINGTAPEYAVDIEPNKSGPVSDVDIEQIKIRSKSGILLPIVSLTDSHYIRRIRIINCDIKTKARCICVDGAEDVLIEKNRLINETEDRSIPLVIDHESRNVRVINNKVIKDLQEIDFGASVIFVNPDNVIIMGNSFQGKKCSLGYFVNENHTIKGNKILSRTGFTRIRGSLIENNDYKGESFILSEDNGCTIKNNRVRESK